MMDVVFKIYFKKFLTCYANSFEPICGEVGGLTMEVLRNNPQGRTNLSKTRWDLSKYLPKFQQVLILNSPLKEAVLSNS